jgi:hypothetical protein
MFEQTSDRHVLGPALHWSARILSIISTFLVVLLFVGERFEISRITAREWVGLFLFPLGVIVGFAAAWWKEGAGGAIAIGSLLAFYLLYGLLINGRINQGWAFVVFASPGFLFLLSWLWSRFQRRPALRT